MKKPWKKPYWTVYEVYRDYTRHKAVFRDRGPTVQTESRDAQTAIGIFYALIRIHGSV